MEIEETIYAHFGKLNNFQGQHFQDKMYYFWKPILVGKISSQIYHIQATLELM